MKSAKNVELKKLRRVIDRLDKNIIAQVAKRLAVARKIGALKKAAGVKIRDPERELFLKKLHAQWSKEFKISRETIIEVFELIMKESKRVQK